jgi:hypothetical protein
MHDCIDVVIIVDVVFVVVVVVVFVVGDAVELRLQLEDCSLVPSDRPLVLSAAGPSRSPSRASAWAPSWRR